MMRFRWEILIWQELLLRLVKPGPALSRLLGY
jgi:hypothetical protein